MDCIIHVEQRHGRRVVRIAGTFSAGNVHDLLNACGDDAATTRVSLRDLVSIDEVGVATLRLLRRRGYRLTYVGTHLQMRLARTHYTSPP